MISHYQKWLHPLTFFPSNDRMMLLNLISVNKEKRGFVMGIASLVLGIVSIVIAVFISGFGWVGALLGIVGIVLGAIAKKKTPGDKMGTAGLVLSIIGTVLGVLLYVACIACLGAASAAANEAASSVG